MAEYLSANFGVEGLEVTMKVSVTQLGARMHYAVPRAFTASGQLQYFITDLHAGSWPARVLANTPFIKKRGFVNKLLGRKVGDVPREKIVSLTATALWALAHKAWMKSQDYFLWSDKLYGKAMVRQLEKHKPDVVYCFSPQAFEILSWCKKNRVRSILEAPIAPLEAETAILSEEYIRHPNWAFEKPGNNKTVLEIMDRQRQEAQLADKIVCGSNFVKNQMRLLGYPIEKVTVLPYGVDLPKEVSEKQKHQGPVRILFVGQVGLRKGAPYLVECAKALVGKAIVRVVGGLNIPLKAEMELREWCDVIGEVPRAEIGKHYEWADVFFFPSLCEGSATVIYEALAYGLPVITTENSGSVVSDGQGGRTIEITDFSSAMNKIEAYLDVIKSGLETVDAEREKSIRLANEYSVKNYCDSLIKLAGC
jgi:glycosyltransferase involved in cell wall biosynthesis